MSQVAGYIFTVFLVLIYSPFVFAMNGWASMEKLIYRPQTVATLQCDGGLELQIRTSGNVGAPDPEMGTKNFHTNKNFYALKNGSIIVGPYLVENDTSWGSLYLHFINFNILNNLNNDDRAALLQCLKPYGDKSSSATISIPGPSASTPVFLTVLPGQSAIGTIDGKQVKFEVDKEPSTGQLPGYNIFVDGQSDGSSYIGNVMVQVATQNADGSVQWDIDYH